MIVDYKTELSVKPRQYNENNENNGNNSELKTPGIKTELLIGIIAAIIVIGVLILFVFLRMCDNNRNVGLLRARRGMVTRTRHIV